MVRCGMSEACEGCEHMCPAIMMIGQCVAGQTVLARAGHAGDMECGYVGRRGELCVLLRVRSRVVLGLR